jgi:superfamily I DNA/RNA helicase
MLSTQQKEVVETALDEKGPNMFITGVAGSGKTRVLHEIIR